MDIHVPDSDVATAAGVAALQGRLDDLEARVAALEAAQASMEPEPIPTNEPAGFTPIAEHAFDVKAPPCWQAWGVDMLSIESDADAPMSPPNVGAAWFPGGFPGGSGPINLGSPNFQTPDLYVRFGFKVSADWDGHASGVNKIFFIKDINGGEKCSVIPQAQGSGTDSLHLTIQNEGNGRTGSAGPSVLYAYYGGSNGVSNGVSPSFTDAEIVRGQWHDIELRLVAGTPGSPTGEIHVWMNGVKIMQYVGVQLLKPTVDGSWNLLQWNPTYGGGSNDSVPADQYQYIDHLYLSGP